MNTDWLIPDWPAAPNVRAVFTSRSGGVSARPWDSLNLGDHVGDEAKNVASNRSLLQQATGTKAVFLKQVHGFEVANLAADIPDGFEADACVTAKANLACTIMVADCLPVLLSNTAGTVVAAAHAGWRGLAGRTDSATGSASGILEAAFKSFRAVAQMQRAQSAINNEASQEVIAWLGPCIGPTAFEVGAEVKTAFEAVQPQATACFSPTTAGKYLADLPALARLRLAALGVKQVYGNDGSASWCTVSQPKRFFSHRRDAGPADRGGNGFATTGRMAGCIWLDPV